MKKQLLRSRLLFHLLLVCFVGGGLAEEASRRRSLDGIEDLAINAVASGTDGNDDDFAFQMYGKDVDGSVECCTTAEAAGYTGVGQRGCFSSDPSTFHSTCASINAVKPYRSVQFCDTCSSYLYCSHGFPLKKDCPLGNFYDDRFLDLCVRESVTCKTKCSNGLSICSP